MNPLSHESSASPRERTVPLTESQKGLYTLCAMDPGASRAYNESLTCRLRGPYNHAAMEAAFQVLADTHEALRARVDPDGESQTIARSVHFPVPLGDLTALPGETRAAETARLLHEFSQVLFDPAKPPLFRAMVVKQDEDVHLLTVTHGAIYGNGPSRKNIVEQALDVYAARDGRVPPMQLSEYVARRALDENDPRHEAFWTHEFPDAPVPLELPSDFPRPPAPSYRGERAWRTVDKQTTAALRQVASAHQCSLFALVLTTWQVLLHRLSGQDDLVVGVPSDSRLRSAHPGGPALIANTTNLLPLRSRFNAGMRFSEQLERTRQLVAGAIEHQEYFFGRILDRLNLVRDPARSPLFSVALNFQKAFRFAPAGALEAEPLRHEYPYQAARNSAAFDLFLHVTDQGSALELHADFCSDLFLPETVERWLKHLCALFESVVADPGGQCQALPILTSAERTCLLQGWNETHRDYPTDIFLHQFVERQVARTPDGVAVVYEGDLLTYGELNARANRIAHRLQALGIAPGALVGLLAERSPEMVIGILAILKAGGAYVPLEPNYPEERLHFLLQDAQSSVVLLQRRYRPKVAGFQGLVVELEADFTTEGDANPVSGVGRGDAAYVIYTSGSTGKPKGVLNSHGGLANWLFWMQETFPMGSGDTMLFKAPFTFDVSVREVFMPLAVGGCMVVARPGLHGDSRHLVDLTTRHGVTILHFVPPMLAAFLEDRDVRRCSSLRLVMCSGDALSYDLQERFFDVFPGLELHNMWGATEHAPESTHWRCVPGRRNGIVAVGRPGANTQLYILDRAFQPVPIGVTGEAYLGGVQTALGYLGRPELTAQKFLPNPYHPGTLYRTGDLGRFRPDGVMEFMGRIDFQVKLRGFRVELGEIEAVLLKHAGIRECVAAVRGAPSDPAKRLVAYLVGDPAPVDSLRRHAALSLPEYMVPSAFVFLDRLPVTANGKLDRSALPEPAMEVRVAREPRDATEAQLIAIWEKVLGRSPVGVTDNFFDLGGNSLLALKAFSLIREVVGVNLPLATLFQAPNVERLAAKVRETAADQEWEPLVAIQLQGSRPPFFAVHGRNGNVLFYRKLSELLGSQQPFYGLQSQGLDGKPMLRSTVEEIGEYYLEKIRAVQPQGPYLLGGYSFGAVAAYEIARRLREQGEEIALLAMFDIYNPARPPRLLSYTEKFRHRIMDAEARTPNRVLQFLARRTKGRVSERLLKWNELSRRLLLQTVKRTEDNSPELVDLHVQMVHERAFVSYRPRPFNGKITLFRALMVPDGYEYEAEMGWTGLAAQGIEIHDVPGDHFTIFHEENVPMLAEKLSACIEAALTSIGSGSSPSMHPAPYPSR
ncbi:MAG TPA: amino acid adenylation domain-containing protein [Chthoniobacterales bacterium]